MFRPVVTSPVVASLGISVLFLLTGCGAGTVDEVSEAVAQQVGLDINPSPTIDNEADNGSEDLSGFDPGSTSTDSGQNPMRDEEQVSDSGTGGSGTIDQPAAMSRIRVSWSIPELRENGDALELSEIGGYILRFTHTDTGDEYTYEVTDPSVDDVSFQLDVSYLSALGAWQYQILAYDVDGVYGNYSTPASVLMN